MPNSHAPQRPARAPSPGRTPAIPASPRPRVERITSAPVGRHVIIPVQSATGYACSTCLLPVIPTWDGPYGDGPIAYGWRHAGPGD